MIVTVGLIELTIVVTGVRRTPGHRNDAQSSIDDTWAQPYSARRRTPLTAHEGTP
jgi:hypothetical protein